MSEQISQTCIVSPETTDPFRSADIISIGMSDVSLPDTAPKLISTDPTAVQSELSGKYQGTEYGCLIEGRYTEYLWRNVEQPEALTSSGDRYLDKNWRLSPLPSEIQVMTIERMRNHRATSLISLFESGIGLECIRTAVDAVVTSSEDPNEPSKGEEPDLGSETREFRSLTQVFEAYQKGKGDGTASEKMQIALASQPWILPHLGAFTSELLTTFAVGQSKSESSSVDMRFLALANSEARLFHQARELLICANTCLVASRIDNDLRFAFRQQSLKDDLLAIGTAVIGHALDKYSPIHDGKPIKFSTYAVHWIHQAMGRHLDVENHVLHVPAYMMETVTKIGKEWKALDRAGRAVSDKTRYFVSRLCEEHEGMSAGVAQALVNLVSGMEIRLDHLADEDASLREDRVTPLVCHNDERDVAREELATFLGPALESLSDKERRVLNARFGFNNEEPKTYAEIAAQEGVSRGTIRGLERRAIQTLFSKCPKGAEDLLELY